MFSYINNRKIQQQVCASIFTTSASRAAHLSSAMNNSLLLVAAAQQRNASTQLKGYKTVKSTIFSKVVRTSKKPKNNFYGGPTKPKINTTYTHQLLTSYSKANSWKNAIKLFDAILAKNGRPEIAIYRKWLNCIGVRGRQPKEAVRIFEHMKSVHPKGDLGCYNEMIRAFAKVNDYSKARKYFDDLSNSKYLKPNSHSYSCLLRSLCPPKPKAAASGEQQAAPVALSEVDTQRAQQIVEMIKLYDPALLSSPQVKLSLAALQITVQ